MTSRLKLSEKVWPHFVYRLFDKADHLLYIGMSEDVVSRIYLHRTQHASTFAYSFSRLIDHYTTEEYPNAVAAHAAEIAAIQTECPPMNLHHNPKVWHKLPNGISVPVNGYPQILIDDICFILRDANGEPIERAA